MSHLFHLACLSHLIGLITGLQLVRERRGGAGIQREWIEGRIYVGVERGEREQEEQEGGGE